jgi:hypothetical protein
MGNKIETHNFNVCLSFNFVGGMMKQGWVLEL